MVARMSRRFRNGAGELAPKLILPPVIQDEMRKRLAGVEEAPHATELEARRREALGVVRGLEIAVALEAARIERLYILIDDVASARGLELEQEG